jgi:D-alanyl-D-alanine carboxypeptidase/D-alanyl-D-alanine-endopeptidase (penicillin-binding protein 4)
MRSLLLASLLLSTSSFAVASTLEERLDAVFLAAPVASRTHLALTIEDAETSTVLYQRGGDRLFTPASVLKTYTSACALDTFGPDHRFTTTVATRGTIQSGQLRGDLALIAGGDPMLKSEDLAELAVKTAKELVVHTVTGDLVLDISLFDVPLKGPGWMWDDDPDEYNMSITAAMADFNVVSVRAMAADATTSETVTIRPNAPYPPVVVTRDPATTVATITRAPFTHEITVTLPTQPGWATAERQLTMHDPALWIAEVFRAELAKAGVIISGSIRIARTPFPCEPKIVHEGKTLAEAVKHFNKVSENAIGEMLLLHLAREGGTKPGTWPAGAATIQRWLEAEVGVEAGTVRIVDGSGLSRYNTISPSITVQVLRKAWNSSWKSAFFDSLPVYSVALPSDAKSTRDLIHAKPGGMSGVSTLGGYVQGLDGRWYIFAYFANGYVGSNADVSALRQKLMTEVIRQE